MNTSHFKRVLGSMAHVFTTFLHFKFEVDLLYQTFLEGKLFSSSLNPLDFVDYDGNSTTDYKSAPLQIP